MRYQRETSLYTAVAITGVCALLTWWLAWPRFQSSYRYLPVETALQRYYSSREIPSDRLPVLIQYAKQSIDYNDHYRFHDGLSILHFLRAMDLNTPAMERLPSYEAAAIEAIESLQRAPAQPATWLRLANIRWILHEEPEDVLTPWKMSVFTGRSDISLFSQRIEIALAHWEFMNDEAIAMFRDQLLLAWRMKPSSLMAALSRRDRSLSVTRALIETTNPLALSEMEAWLERTY